MNFENAASGQDKVNLLYRWHIGFPQWSNNYWEGTEDPSGTRGTNIWLDCVQQLILKCVAIGLCKILKHLWCGSRGNLAFAYNKKDGGENKY